MDEQAKTTLAAVRQHFAGCNAADADLLRQCSAEDIVYYYLDPGTQPVRGAEESVAWWVKVSKALDGHWTIDNILVSGEQAALEWTYTWTSKKNGERRLTRGTDWFLVRDGRVAEVRAYFVRPRDEDSELEGFDYAGRGYETRRHPSEGEGTP